LWDWAEEAADIGDDDEDVLAFLARGHVSFSLIHPSIIITSYGFLVLGVEELGM
jgi:hypothetical protein